jgi:hypothetical protein
VQVALGAIVTVVPVHVSVSPKSPRFAPEIDSLPLKTSTPVPALVTVMGTAALVAPATSLAKFTLVGNNTTIG